RCLPGGKEGLRVLAFAAQLERAEIFIPTSFRHVRLRFDPDAKLVQVFEVDAAITHSLDQVITNANGQPRPCFDLRHYSPKMNRPSSFPSSLISAGSFDERKRSARSKKAFSFCFWVSMPSSMSSTRTRLSLRWRRFASLSTCLAT